MVSEDEIDAEGLTQDDVLERETVQPQEECEWLPEWDEFPEERPGENTHLEDGVLFWERDGFDVRLESYQTTHWKATVSIPREIGQHYGREIDLKCKPRPEYGYVESVEIEDYASREVVLILQENFMPTVEVNAWITDLIEEVERDQAWQEELMDKINRARENEQ